MKLFILGDTHGNTGWGQSMVKRAAELRCDAIVQVGDFGIWPGPDGDKFLRKLNKTLSEHDLPLFFVDGNHEDFPKLERMRRGDGMSALVMPNGQSNDVLTYIVHVPRGYVWSWSGRRLMGLGGAVSIDRQWRKPGKSWWPQEQLTDEQAEAACKAIDGPIDVLFTHDAPTNVPMPGMKEDIDSTAHRQRVTAVARVAQPSLWFHGHYHRAMDYEFGYPPRQSRVIGLGCDGDPDCYATLNLATLNVVKAKEHRYMDRGY